MTAQPTNTPADDAPYWDAALETQTRADWDAMKLELLKAHLEHAYNGSPYYRASFDTAGVHPGQVSSLDDLRRFPFIDKHALRDRQLAVPPLGDLAAVPERDVVYLSASSGSTGVPTASLFTAGDFDDWIDYEARQFWSSGLRPVDRYCHCLNFSLFIGGPCVLGAQKLGALGIHAGTLPSERLLLILRQFQATAMWTTPSYAWALGETTTRSWPRSPRCGAGPRSPGGSSRQAGTSPPGRRSSSPCPAHQRNPAVRRRHQRRAAASRGRLHRDRGAMCRSADPARLARKQAPGGREPPARGCGHHLPTHLLPGFLPISFLAGFWGQNFDVLTGSIEKGWPAFLVLGVGLSVACVAVIVFMLGRRGWK